MRSPGPLFLPSPAAFELPSRGCPGRAHVELFGGLGWRSQLSITSGDGLPIVVGGAANGPGRTLVDGLRLRRQGSGAHATGPCIAQAHPLLIRSRDFLHGRERNPNGPSMQPNPGSLARLVFAVRCPPTNALPSPLHRVNGEPWPPTLG